jgi:hypothetical protein
MSINIKRVNLITGTRVSVSTGYEVKVKVGAPGPRGQGLINLDGGTPSTNYGGIQSIDAGGVTN